MSIIREKVMLCTIKYAEVLVLDEFDGQQSEFEQDEIEKFVHFEAVLVIQSEDGSTTMHVSRINTQRRRS